MPRFTIVANTPKPVLYLDFQGETSRQLFDNLLTGNPKSTSVPKLLVASNDFKDRLQLMDVVGDKVYEPKAFFNDIPTGEQFLFIIPFCSLDKYKFIGESRQSFFINGLKEFMPISLEPVRFDGIKPQKLMMDMNIEISPDCVEGRDYYFIDPKTHQRL